MHFSGRLPDDLSPSRFAAALEKRRASGVSILDLTVSNPTAVGLPTPRTIAFPDECGALYEPHPLGSDAARGAVADYFAQRSIPADPNRIFLSASTSETYAHLFRLLADAGDNFLVPRPSYPLLEPLAALEAVRLVPYPLRLEDDGRWRPDLTALRHAMDERTRGVLVVHPNNPTGSLWRTDDWGALVHLSAEHQLAIVSDEVFGDFVYADTALPSLAGNEEVLSFVLGGLSKTCGAPHAKLAWTLVGGPDAAVREVVRRLEWIGDAYLSVASPVQAALPRLLGERHAYLATARARVLANRDLLVELFGSGGATEGAAGAGMASVVLPIDGGWTTMLRLPAGADEERLALRLLEAGVLVQPGYFFDAPAGEFLAVSLLVPKRTFAAGARVIASLAG